MNILIGLSLFAVLVIFGGLGYLVYIALKALTEVKASPREEMFWCEKHGPIRSGGTIEFVGVKACGICFHQKLSSAERVH